MFDALTNVVTNRPRVVVAVFLVATLFIGFGATQVSTQGGAGDFTESTEEIEALEDAQDAFGPDENNTTNTVRTTLLLRDDNAIGKEQQTALLQTLQRVADAPNQSVARTESFPQLVAQRIDPTARTLDEQQAVLENATDEEVRQASRSVLQSPAGDRFVAKNADEENVTASATRAFVVHNVSFETSPGRPSQDIQMLQRGTQEIVTNEDIVVYGDGVVGYESGLVTSDSLLLVMPLAFLLISVSLGLSYRTGRDIFIGIATLLLAVVWTFGTIGWLGVPVTAVVTIVPVILLAVGVDFGIHVINRYREEDGTPRDAMRAGMRQLLVAFFLVAVTTVIGFGSNITSPLAPLRDYGVAAAVGIIATAVLFGIFLPAAKLVVGESSGGRSAAIGDLPVVRSALSKVVTGVSKAPKAILILTLVMTALFGAYGAGLDSEFEQSNFQAPEDRPAYTESLPEPFKPHDYQTTATRMYIEQNFEGENRTSVLIVMNGNLSHPDTLERFAAVRTQTPDAFTLRGETTATGPLTVINQTRDRDSTYAAIVRETDTDGNGVPDTDLNRVYDPLTANNGQLSQFISDDRRTAQVIYTADINESQTTLSTEGTKLADRYDSDGINATATGRPLVLKAVSDLITESVVRSLAIGLALSLGFLAVAYWRLDGRPVLGLANIVPILFGIAAITATMRLAGIDFNAVTSLILSTALGLGLDYSVHITHRFTDEFDGENPNEAVLASVRGTGGALTGTMVTTFSGLGTLALALFPVLFQFGLLIGLTILYTYIATLTILPAALVVYANWRT